MMLSNRWYDILKYVCQIGLPAVLAFLSAVLGLLSVDPQTIAIIVGIGTAVDTLLGTLLGISTYNYNKAGKETSGEQNDGN